MRPYLWLEYAAVAKLRKVLEYRDLPIRSGKANGRAMERIILNEGTRRWLATIFRSGRRSAVLRAPGKFYALKELRHNPTVTFPR